MRTSILPLVVLFILSGSVFGQIDWRKFDPSNSGSPNDIPGSFDDIKGLSKVCVIADKESRKAILKELKKQPAFIIVDKLADAEFVLVYSTISPEWNTQFDRGMTETGRLVAYVRRNGKRVVAWSEKTTDRAFYGNTAHDLIDKFLKRAKKL